MSYRKEALIDLRDKAKAGEWQAAGDGNDSWLAIFDAGLQPVYAWIYGAWDRNSLDAAKALHEAVLPGAFWNMGHLDEPSLGYVATVAQGHFPDSPSWRGYAQNPARAWLLAILEALIAQEADA